MMKKFLFLLVFCNSFWAYSQNDYNDSWFIYFGNQQIDKNWNWWTEAQFRNENPLGEIQQLLVRTGIGYNLTENNDNLLIGYGYITNYAENALEKTKLTSKEHRIYQQYIKKNKIGNVPLQHRFRLEQRFRENQDFQLRGRYFVGANIPLTKNFMQKNSTYVSLYNELFLIPEDNILDRNRFYAALGYVLNKNTRIEVGYMNQSVNTQGMSLFSPNSNQSQIQFAIFNTINFN